MRDFMGAWRALFLVGVLASTFLATSQMGTVLDVASMDTSWKREASLSLHHLLLTPTTSLIWQQNNDANAEHAALSAAAVSSTSNYYQQPRKSSRFTYAFVLGGVNPHRPAYRGLLWGVMVNVYALQRYGSTADLYYLSNSLPMLSMEPTRIRLAWRPRNCASSKPSAYRFGTFPRNRAVGPHKIFTISS